MAPGRLQGCPRPVAEAARLPETVELSCCALMNRAAALHHEGRGDEGAALWGDVMERFGADDGLGVNGAAHTRIEKTTMTFPATTTTVPGGSRTGLAWMATAGASAALKERVSLNLAWRYSDLGEVRTAGRPGRVVWRDGSREPLPLDLVPTKARLKGHGVGLSLRYAF